MVEKEKELKPSTEYPILLTLRSPEGEAWAVATPKTGLS
jgi:hypothetical protein